MAKSVKQQLNEQLAAQHVQQALNNIGLEQFQAAYNDWNNQQEGLANFEAQFNAWNEANPVQTAEPVKGMPKQQKAIPSLEKTVDLSTWFTPRTASGRDLNKEAAEKKSRNQKLMAEKKKAMEEYQRQQQEEQILAQPKFKTEDLKKRISNSDKAISQEYKDLSEEEKALEEQILNADKYNVPVKEEKKSRIENPFYSDYLTIRTQNDLGRDRKAIQAEEVIKKYAEAKGISVDQARAEFEKAEAMKGQSITAPGTRDLASLEATDKAKVDLQASRLLDPNNKLYSEEKKEARELAQSELAKFEYGSDKKPILRTDEERQHYADMVNLLNKTNPVTNTMTGYIQQPLNLARAARDAGRTVGNDLTGLGAAIGDKTGLTEDATQRHNERVEAADNFFNQNDASMDMAYQNAMTQNPVLTKGGDFAGNMTMYNLTNPVFDSIATAAGLGKAGTFLLNQGAQNLQDLALDTLPTLNRYMDDGTLSDNEKLSLTLGGALNVGGNLVMPALMNGWAKILQGLDADRASREAADAAFRANVSEGADKLVRLNLVSDAAESGKRRFGNLQEVEIEKFIDDDGELLNRIKQRPEISLQSDAAKKPKEQLTQEANSLMSQIYDYQHNKLKKKTKITVGKVPEILKEYGMKDGDLYINQKDIKKVLAFPWEKVRHSHGIGTGAFEALPEKLDNPVAILSGGSNNKADSLTVLTDLADMEGDPVLVALKVYKDGSIEFDNRLASTYGKRNIKHYLSTELGRGNILYFNQTKSASNGVLSQLQSLADSKGAPNVGSVDQAVPSTSNITDAIPEVNKETINNFDLTANPFEGAAETTIESAIPKLDLPTSTQDALLGDMRQFYDAITADEEIVKALDNETVNAAFDRVKQSLFDYEEKLFKSTDMSEVDNARRAVTSARKNLERQIQKVDPTVKAEITKYKYGPLADNAKYYRDRLEPPSEEHIYNELRAVYDLEGKSPEEIERIIEEDRAYEAGLRAKEDAFNQRMNGYLPEDMTSEVGDVNKVMAEDIGLEPTKSEPVESLKIEEEVPPTRTETTGTTPPENGDYVSKFRTHNEQNFNMTDEELNNKYFNTQNENFHFLKGDRAADLENATKNLETDYDGTVNKLLTKPTDTQFTPQEVDEGFMAWNRELQAARETGDYGKSADIMYRMTRDAHDKGAGLQAYAAWKKNSPAGVVLDASESARKMAVDQFGDSYIKELDSLTDKINDICKGNASLDDKIKQIDQLMKDAQAKGYKNGISGAEQMKELLETGDNIDVSHIHDILYEANKVPNLSASSQAEIAQIASEMYGKKLTDAEKRKYINQINMILSREKHWSIKDKAIEISHILMLSGTRTHLKNFVANVGMLPQEALARKISAVGQKAYRHFVDPNYKSTQAFVVGKDAKTLAEKAYNSKGGANAIASGVADKFTNQIADKIGANYMFGVGKENIASKANKALTNAIPGLKKVEDAAGSLADKALKKIGSEGAYDAMDANVSLLENYRQAIYGSLSGLEDNPFVKKNYVDRLASYIQAQGFKSLDEIPEEAFDIASAEALKATFKDDNAITELFKSIKGIPVVGELTLPFVKTPANLLARSIDFSPIGLARSLYGAVNKNSRFAKDTIGETIDEISKGAGGTLTMLLGMYLYANGLITGKKSDDPEVANYMSNEGWQEYSISTKGIADFINSKLGTTVDLGDNYYDFSFLQPSTTNMIAAEEVWDELMDGKKLTEKDMDSIFNRVKSIAGSYTDALLAQSTMQNVAELFGSQYSDDGVGGNLMQSALEWPTRFTSGALSDISKLGDDTKREYYSKNKPLETVKNAVVSKLPGLSKTLPAKYDVFGEEMTRNKTTGQKWINTLLNPTTTSQRSENPLYGYVDSINEQSASGDYIPDKTLRKIKLNDETEYSLDNKEYSEASRIAGEMRTSFLNDAQSNDLFNSLSADDQAAILNNLEKVAISNAYTTINENAKVTEDAQKYRDLYNEGGADAVIKDYVGKQMVKDAGVSSSSKAAEEAKAAVASGNVDKANRILNAETEMKTAITNAGLEVNDTTKAIYQSDKDEGLKTWSSMTSKGLTDKRAYDVYQSAINSSDSIPTLDKWISTYKTIDSLSKPNGHVDQTEFKAFLNKGKNGKKYTQAEAEELARIYGDWTTTPYIPTTGKNKGQWSFH